MADDQQTYDAWIPIEEVVRQITAAGATKVDAIKSLIVRLEGGLIVAMFKTALTQTLRGPSQPSQFQRVAHTVWARLNRSGETYKNSVWNDGDLIVHEANTSSLYDGGTTYKYLKLRLNPDDVADLLPAARGGGANKALPVAAPAKHAGGAPAKPIWESVWIEIAARLYNGDLKPTKQKDIEAAIIEIVMNFGDECGEATARRRANPLWKKIKQGS